MSELTALREENDNLKKEVEALLQAKEIAKEKVRSAIQELVDENKRLKKKVTTLEAQVASLLAERNSLIQRLGDGTNGNGNFIPETNGDSSPASGRRVSISEESQPIERSYSSDDLNGRTVKKGGGVEVSSLTGSMRAAPSRRPSSSKAAGLLGLTENKIMVELQHVPEALTIEEPGILMMRLENDLLDIKGGVLEKLVERLYHATTASQAPNYVPNFILTLRAFATPLDVATILIEAYGNQEDKDGRERVLKVFAKWLELQPEDFQIVGDKWDKFLKDSVLRLDGKEWVKDLQKAALIVSSRVAAPLLEGKEPSFTTSAQASPRSAKKEKLPKSIVPRSKGFNLDDLDAVEIARQLSMMDYELFQKIRPSEFNNLSWTRRTKETDAPNLLRMIHRFNEVSIWVQYVIVSADSARKRASYVEKFVKIGQQFLKQKNYNGIMQIVSALEGAAIHRLNKTFEKVKPGTKKKYIALHELMSGTSSYKMYRESLQDKEPPCIPYVGVHLTDLTAMCETHKNTLGPKYPDYLNMAKHMNVANLIKMLMRLQESSYQFYQVPIIRDWLEVQLNLFGATPEEKLFEMSLTIEPRED